MRSPRLALLGLLLGLTAASRPAGAAETDYLPDNLAWNGLSELSDLARGMQLRLELLEELDWTRLPARSTLFIVYPRGELDPLELAAFVGRGGQALIADDFGDAGPLLQKIGIPRVEATELRAVRYHEENRKLPVATPGARHPLVSGIREVVSNHPAAFRSSLPGLLVFEEDLQLLVAARLGKGTLVALSDPSVLINGMLRFEGNLTLATNLLRTLTPAEGGSIYVLTGHFRARGRRALPAAPGREDQVARFLTEYNAFIGSLNDFAFTAPALRTLAFMAGSLTLVALLVLLPFPRRDPDGHWLRPQSSPRGGYEEQVRRGGLGTALVPALVLREELEEALTELLLAPGPVFTIHPGWVIRRVREGWGLAAAELAERLLARLRQLPQSGEEGGQQRLSRFRAGELAELHNTAEKLLAMLRAGPEASPDRPSTEIRG